MAAITITGPIAYECKEGAYNGDNLKDFILTF
jgi:hypothetical protein